MRERERKGERERERERERYEIIVMRYYGFDIIRRGKENNILQYWL